MHREYRNTSRACRGRQADLEASVDCKLVYHKKLISVNPNP